MGLSSELVLKNFIPAVRVAVAKQLATRYNFNQVEIAELLGITQAAVSKYLAGNYSLAIKLLEQTPRIKEISRQIVGKIVLKKRKEKADLICKICKSYSGHCLYKHFALELEEALQKKTKHLK
jgi:predicted transcriptional regulator